MIISTELIFVLSQPFITKRLFLNNNIICRNSVELKMNVMLIKLIQTERGSRVPGPTMCDCTQDVVAESMSIF